MVHRISLTFAIAVLALLSPLATAEESAGEAEILSVFLQGSSAVELRTLVEAQGGEVTHDLPIIDAVGARLSASQLEKVLESDRVTRFMDDLSLPRKRQDDPREADEACQVRGSLELDIGDSSVSWRLRNKGATTATLQRLSLGWPAQLGKIERITLAGKEIDPDLYSGASKGVALIELNDKPDHKLPPLSGTEKLKLEFRSAAGQSLHQRDFSVEATFAGDCTVELVPGYDDNHENFYYNTVVGVDALHRNGITGRGVTVAVVDSGLWSHPHLTNDTRGKPRVLARFDAIANSAGGEVFDESGHGTHMTSIIAHSGAETRAGIPTGGYKGVAPDVNLVSVKAFDVAGQGDFLDIMRALQWVVDNREAYNIRVLNLSFSSRPRWQYWLDPINQAVMRAWASGITVIAAAGNEGPDPMSIGSPGNLPFVITVGAVTDSWTATDKDDDYIPDFSSRGPTPSGHVKPDLVAPGGHITGLVRPGSTLTQEHPEYILRTGEFVMTGSSQAAALVSGVAALLLQLEPALTPDDIKCKLMTSAEPAINRDGLLAYSPFQQGQGYVNATRAVTLGQRGCGNADMDILRELTGTEHTQGPAVVDADGAPSLPGLGTMLSPEPAAEGLSKTRKWGVKAHIERNEPSPTPGATPDGGLPSRWMQLYLDEREAIERLSRQTPR